MKKGFTSKPCHGCGKEGHRKKDELCYHCRLLMNDAISQRGKSKNNKDLVSVILGHHPKCQSPRDYSIEGAAYICRSKTNAENMKNAMWKLADSFCVPNHNKHGDVGHEYSFRSDDIGDQLMGYVMGGNHNIATYGNELKKYKLADKKIVEAFRGAHKEIRNTMAACYKAGKMHGQNLWAQLHSGEININSFNKELDKLKD